MCPSPGLGPDSQPFKLMGQEQPTAPASASCLRGEQGLCPGPSPTPTPMFGDTADLVSGPCPSTGVVGDPGIGWIPSPQQVRMVWTRGLVF